MIRIQIKFLCTREQWLCFKERNACGVWVSSQPVVVSSVQQSTAELPLNTAQHSQQSLQDIRIDPCVTGGGLGTCTQCTPISWIRSRAASCAGLYATGERTVGLTETMRRLRSPQNWCLKTFVAISVPALTMDLGPMNYNYIISGS